MNSIVNHVVLTGGVGSRLWPLSRKSKPKQYLNFHGDTTLFEQTIIRNISFTDNLIVVGNQDNLNLSKESLLRIKYNKNTKHIVESASRNTAAAIAFAAFSTDPKEILLITPSDHVIKNNSLYKEAISKAFLYAENGFLVTFGVKPTRPETGYGYIESKEEDVISFREKPSLEKAIEFFNQGDFCWNSGMFCFQSNIFLNELKKHEPKLYDTSKKAWENSKKGILGFDDSIKIPSISVDYAVMEKSKLIKVVASSFDWSDLGSFESLYDYLKECDYPIDQNGNMVIGSDLPTTFLGLSNCILVQTKDAVLILNKENSQDVKKIYQELEKQESKLL